MRILCILPPLIGLAACGSPEAGPPTEVEDRSTYLPTVDGENKREYFRERVLRVEEMEDGSFVVSFHLSSRYHQIHPQRSPNATEIVEFARASMATDREVYVTIDTTGTPSKKTPESRNESGSRMPLILRLADTPDPETPASH